MYIKLKYIRIPLLRRLYVPIYLILKFLNLLFERTPVLVGQVIYYKYTFYH